jgi:hypothetical protein
MHPPPSPRTFFHLHNYFQNLLKNSSQIFSDPKYQPAKSCPHIFGALNVYLRYNSSMSEKNAAARKSYWENLSPEERSNRMRAIATSRQKKMTFKQKRDHALKMVAARHKKQVDRKTLPIM